MGTESPGTAAMRAMVDFACLDAECKAPIRFNLMELAESKGQLSCPTCRRPYDFDAAFLDKLERLRRLILTVKEAEDILGDANVAVTVPGSEVRIPYRLLLTRLNTLITLDVQGRRVDFNFRVEPLNNSSFK